MPLSSTCSWQEPPVSLHGPVKLPDFYLLDLMVRTVYILFIPNKLPLLTLFVLYFNQKMSQARLFHLNNKSLRLFFLNCMRSICLCTRYFCSFCMDRHTFRIIICSLSLHIIIVWRTYNQSKLWECWSHLSLAQLNAKSGSIRNNYNSVMVWFRGAFHHIYHSGWW